MSIEPNRPISIAVPLPLLGLRTREKERVDVKAILESPLSKLNIATHRAFSVVDETVNKLLKIDGEISPLQSELLNQASHTYIQRRLQEACLQLPSSDKIGISQAEDDFGLAQTIRNNRIMDELNRFLEPRRQPGIDLLSEQMSESSKLKRIDPQSIASNVIDAVANLLFALATDPKLDFMENVDEKTKKRVRAMSETIEAQIKKFVSGKGINLPGLIRHAEEMFDLAGENLILKAQEKVDIYSWDNLLGKSLVQSFESKGFRLIDGLQAVLSQGAVSYSQEDVELTPEPEISSITQEAQTNVTPLPNYFTSPTENNFYQSEFFKSLTPAISVAASSIFLNLLSTSQKIGHDVKQLLHNLDPKEPRGRKNLVNLLLLVVLLAACTPQGDISPDFNPAVSPTPLSPLMTDKNIPPEMAVLMSLAGRTNFDILGILPLDPAQRELLYQIIVSNQESVLNGIPEAQLNIDPSLKIGCSICSDSRVIARTPSVADGLSIMPEGILLDSANIGTQPTVYAGVNQSFFITHGACIDNISGCGALGGVKAILEDPKYGRLYLSDHGVSELTINQLDDLIRQGATADPMQWAITGARAQAEINFAANGTNHFVAVVFKGHADDSLQVIGVVDALHPDQIFSIDDFPLLKGYAEYFNNPHPIIDALAAGQAPKINVINGSKKFTTSAILGDIAAEPGVVFKTATRGNLTYQEAINMVGGFDYSAAHLTQRGNFLTIVADNAQDMTLLRTALLNEGVKNGTMAQFLERGGVIVEMIPDEAGRFGTITIRRAEELGVELRRLDLMKSGLLSVTTRAEFVELAKANKLGSMLTEKQIVRLAKFYEVARPVLPYLKFGLQAIGDYYTIKDVAKFVDEDLMGHELVYDYYPPINKVIFAEGYNGYNKMSMDEYRTLKEAFPDVSPYIISGLVRGISINQGALSDAYLGAFNAYYDRGPGMPNAAPPWNQIESGQDLGKMLIFTVPFEYPLDTHDYTVSPLRLHTSLTIKPAYVIEKDGQGNETARYLSFQPQTLNDDNSSMMLIDEVTGLFTSLNPDDGPIQFLAVDENGFRYLMEAVPNLETKSFEFRFIAPLGPS